MKTVKIIFTAMIIAGVIILDIGLYYLIIKAGIPYQDPTPELQLKYSINMGIGEILTRTGLCITVIGAIVRITVGLISINKQEYPQ